MTNAPPCLIIPLVSDQSELGSGRNRWFGAGILLLILLLALGLRFYRLDAQSLWNDEGTSVALAHRDPVTIARDAAQDIHPPLYYWVLSCWVRLLGDTEGAVRSLSALLGVALVALTYALGRELASRGVGLLAALLAAIHPFQVYYSQETRMYMLLAVLTAGAVLAQIHFVKRPFTPRFIPGMFLILFEAAGLYTHYSFVFVIAVLNVTALLWFARTRQATTAPWRGLKWWAGAQMCALLLYLPWLPIAIRRVTAWPSPEQSTAFLPAVVDTWRWLVFGPTTETANVTVALAAAGLLTVVGVASLGTGHYPASSRSGWWVAGTLALWIGLPVVLMFGLGLYRDAYLKFLLVTSPAIAILMAAGFLYAPSTWGWRTLRAQPSSEPRMRGDKGDNPPRRLRPVLRLAGYTLSLGQLVAAVAVFIASAQALHNVYADPAYARDNYRDIAGYVNAVGRTGDSILLNAPGQREVFAYYYDRLEGDLPIYPLPESRPLDPEATGRALERLSRPGGRVFAVLWATDESDPERFIEGWLDNHTYKALDSWYGNVRLALYAVPEETPAAPAKRLDVPLVNPVSGDEIILLGYSQLNEQLVAGDIAQFTLFWGVHQTPTQRYKVFLHVLDATDQIVGQRDSEPGGGARLTNLWKPDETIVDNYGVSIHPATPPGDYRVEMGVYSLETSQRLLTPDGASQIWLETLRVDRPVVAAPAAALGMQHNAGAVLGDLTLLGYDAYRLGFGHLPETPLRRGDVLHVTVYWLAERKPTGDWLLAINVIGSDEEAIAGVVAEPVAGFPTSKWQAGEVWRGQFNLSIPGTATPGRYRLAIRTLAPDGQVSSETFLSAPFAIGP